MTPDKILYTARATATGGRDGRAVSSDNVLNVSLSTPRELGGAGGPGTNPEQLFAAGYSACFLSAIKFVAGKQKVALPADTSITGNVGIGPIATGFALQVQLGDDSVFDQRDPRLADVDVDDQDVPSHVERAARLGGEARGARGAAPKSLGWWTGPGSRARPRSSRE